MKYRHLISRSNTPTMSSASILQFVFLLALISCALCFDEDDRQQLKESFESIQNEINSSAGLVDEFTANGEYGTEMKDEMDVVAGYFKDINAHFNAVLAAIGSGHDYTDADLDQTEECRKLLADLAGENSFISFGELDNSEDCLASLESFNEYYVLNMNDINTECTAAASVADDD